MILQTARRLFFVCLLVLLGVAGCGRAGTASPTNTPDTTAGSGTTPIPDEQATAASLTTTAAPTNTAEATNIPTTAPVESATTQSPTATSQSPISNLPSPTLF